MMPSAQKAPPYVLMPNEQPVVFLDANVLLPTHLRAVFLDYAHAGLLRVHWEPGFSKRCERTLKSDSA